MVRRFLLATLLVAASCLFVARAYGFQIDAYGQRMYALDEVPGQPGQPGKPGQGSAPPVVKNPQNPQDPKIPPSAPPIAGAMTKKIDPTLKDETQKAQNMATIQKVGALAGAGLSIYQCVTTPWPLGASFCAAAIPLLLQAKTIGDYQKNAQQAIDKTIATTSSDTPGTPGFVAPTSIDSESPNYPAPPGFRSVEELQKKLAEKGFDVKGNQTTLPNGKTVPTASLGTSSGLTAAGLDGATAEKVKDLYELEKANAEKSLAKNAKNKGDDVGSAGGGRYSGSSLLSEESENASGSWQTQTSPRRGIASVAGASKKLGSDNIGVSADNIFQMVQRRYNKKRQLKQFIE